MYNIAALKFLGVINIFVSTNIIIFFFVVGLFCPYCDHPHYLRSGNEDHMRNTHNMDVDGNVLKKKADKRRKFIMISYYNNIV